MTSTNVTPHELIEQGQALVRSLATRIAHNIPVPVDFDDLIAYGQLGLAEAAREFDPSFRVQFTTFAYYRIRGAIYDGISKMSWTSRARYRHRYRQMANAALAEEHAAAPGGDATLEEEVGWLGGVAEKLAVIYLVSRGEEGGGIRESWLEDPAAGPAATVARREICDRLRELVRSLPPAEHRLIEAIYFEGFTLQQAADRLGISKSWASRLHAKTLEHLGRTLRGIGAEE